MGQALLGAESESQLKACLPAVVHFPLKSSACQGKGAGGTEGEAAQAQAAGSADPRANSVSASVSFSLPPEEGALHGPAALNTLPVGQGPHPPAGLTLAELPALPPEAGCPARPVMKSQ